jgi:uncharacterized damage-inducible protein DinB
MMTQNRPEASEFAPYYEKYIALVPDGPPDAILDRQWHDTKLLLAPLNEQQAEFRYAPGKWSIKETLGHITDTERIFGYRLLRIARGDQAPLSGFEQDDYVKSGNFSARTLADLLEEFSSVRRASLTLLRSLDAAAWTRRGIANQVEVSVRAIAWIIAGHERHHRLILEQRYIAALPRA